MSETTSEQDPKKTAILQGLMLQGYAQERPIPGSEATYVVTDTNLILKMARDHDIPEPRLMTNGFNRLGDHFYNFHREGVETQCSCPLEGRYEPGRMAEFTPQSLMDVAEMLKIEPDALGRYGVFATGAQSVIKIAELLDYVSDLERRAREYDERQVIRKELQPPTDNTAKVNIIKERAKHHFDPDLLIRELQGAASANTGERGENLGADVREMKPDDVYELGNLLRIHPAYREKYAQQIRNGQIKIFVAYLNNRPVARGGLMYEGPPRTEEDPDKLTENDVIELLGGPVPWNFDMWTTEGYRGRGLAPKVTLARIEEVKRLGLPIIALGVRPDNVTSRRVNEKLGFTYYEVDGKPFVFTAHLESEPPQQNLLMVKDLRVQN